MISLVIGFIGIIFGAWLNNIWFWKIKQKIESLDLILRDAIDYNSKILEFTRLKCLSDEPNESDYAELGRCATVYINNGYIANWVIFGSPNRCKDTKIYKSMVEYYKLVAKVFNEKDLDYIRSNFFVASNQEPHEVEKTDYELKMQRLINTVLSYRRDLTSFSPVFWIKELYGCFDK